MAMEDSEANSTLQIPIVGGKEHGNLIAFDQILDLELNNRTRKVIPDQVCCSKKIHRLYFIKFWPYKDPDEASKIGEAEQLIEDLDQKLFQLRREYKLTTLKWIDTHSQIDRLKNKKSSISYGLEWEARMLLDHLQLQLDKLNLASKIPHKHKGQPNRTQGFRSWISHGSNNLAIERKLINEMARSQHRVMNDLDLSSSSLQEQFEQFTSWLSWGDIDKSRYTQMLEKLNQIEEKKEKTLADSATKANIFNSLTLRNAIEEQIEIVKKMSLELRVEQHEAKSAIEGLSKELDPWKEKEFVYDYKTQLWEMLKQKETAQRCILKLRQTFDEMNGMYDENVALLSNARELARNRDIAALRQLSHHQVEEFMSEWNHPYVKSFRVNYEFNILDSLRNRGLSRDGRIEFQDDDQETLRYIEDGSNICCLDSKEIMAMNNSEANSMLRIPVLGDKEHKDSTLDLKLKNKPKNVISDQFYVFMWEWNHPTFRISYEFNILNSLQNCQLRQDGQMEFWDDGQETPRCIEDGSTYVTQIQIRTYKSRDR